MTVEGLTFIGEAGATGNQVAIRADGGSAALQLTVRDCVVTANDGADAPVMTYGIAHPSSGYLESGVTIGEETLTHPSTIVIENSVMAFTKDGESGIIVKRTMPSGSTVTVDGVLFALAGRYSLRFGGDQTGNTFTVRNSAFFHDSTVDNNSRGILLNDFPTGNIVVEDSVFSSCRTGAINCEIFAGNLTVRRCTFYYPDNTDLIIIEKVGPGSLGDFSFTDCIFANGMDSAIRFRPDLADAPAADPAFNTFSLSHLAVSPSSKAYRSVQINAVKAVFDALYGGAGPFGEDPQFVMTQLGSSLDGARRWDAATNFIFDVNNSAFDGEASDGGFLSGGAQDASNQPTPSPTPTPTPTPTPIFTPQPDVEGNQRFEDFADDPRWVGVTNRQLPSPCPTKTQSFRYRSSNNAGGAAGGEIGGYIMRTTLPSYYAKVLDAPLTFDDAFTASGKFSVTDSEGGSTMLFGWFNERLQGWRTANSLVFRIDCEGGYFRVFFEYGTTQWGTGGSAGLPVGDTNFRDTNEYFASNGDTHAWALDYDPDGGHWGRITFTIDEHDPFTLDLAWDHRAQGATFNRFGMFPMMISGMGLRAYFDDITIDGEFENFDTDPGWQGLRNNESYEDCGVRPYHDFGFSETDNVGAGAGEMGGIVWRIESANPQNMGYYADTITPALTLDDRLFAFGKIALVRASSDAGVLLGWLNSNTYNTSDSGLPRNFMGLFIEGPSRVGFYFRPLYNTQSGRRGQAGDGPTIVPDGEAHGWTMLYDPDAEGGLGQITTTLDGYARSLTLNAGDKADGATFDRFGMMSWNNGGHYVDAYFDDVAYTVAETTPTPTPRNSVDKTWKLY